ncbi:MAG TPA: DUF420 domain-containing protein [Urbifossiella sp.]
MPAGPEIILTLKILVTVVTVLLIASLYALAAGRPKLHGQINTVFFVLTMATVAGFETLLQFVDIKSAFDPATREALRIHLYFSIPSAILLPVIFLTGIKRKKQLHLALSVVFLALWTGTFITGVFFLPHN